MVWRATRGYYCSIFGLRSLATQFSFASCCLWPASPSFVVSCKTNTQCTVKPPWRGGTGMFSVPHVGEMLCDFHLEEQGGAFGCRRKGKRTDIRRNGSGGRRRTSNPNLKGAEQKNPMSSWWFIHFAVVHRSAFFFGGGVCWIYPLRIIGIKSVTSQCMYQYVHSFLPVSHLRLDRRFAGWAEGMRESLKKH